MSFSGNEESLGGLFDMMDRNGSGRVNRKEFRKVMQRKPYNLSDSDTEGIFQWLDEQEKRDGKISKAEFIRGMTKALQHQRRK